MPRTRAQPEEIPVPDPAEFADRFCRQRGLLAPELIGTSQAERECMESAEHARTAYKSHRDGEIGRRFEEPCSERSASPRATRRRPPTVADDSGLTPAQKYARRLFNNRKSAAASRVYAEVLRREMATKVHTSSSFPSTMPDFEAKIRALEDERAELFNRLAKLNADLIRERKRTADLEFDVSRRKHRKVSLASDLERVKHALNVSLPPTARHVPHTIKEDIRLLDVHPALQMSAQELDLVHHMGSQNQLGHNTQQSFGFSQPSASAYLNEEVGSHPHPLSQGGSQAPVDGPSQTPSSGEPHLVDQKWPNSMALSSLANEGDAKDFTTGMTCSQSQDVDEKHPLSLPSSIPLSSGPPINNLLTASQLASQQSQELPNFKGAIGSEDNPLAEPGFFLNSQGNSKGT